MMEVVAALVAKYTCIITSLLAVTKEASLDWVDGVVVMVVVVGVVVVVVMVVEVVVVVKDEPGEVKLKSSFQLHLRLNSPATT